MRVHAIVRTSLVAGLLMLAGCGAGLITGIAANQNNNPTGETRPPELTLSPLLPLVPTEGTTRTVVVTNAQIPASAQLRVQIEAAGVVVDQGNLTLSGQGGSTVVAFTLATGPIVAAVGDPTVADVDGQFRVLVDGNPVAAAVPIVLAKQPRAVLDLGPGVDELFLAPSGQLVSMRVTGLLSTEAANVQMLVTTRDPTRAIPPGGSQPTITRVCTGLTLTAATTPGEVIVTASVPGNSFPDGVRLFLVDEVAGRSTDVTNAYYRPAIALVLPRQGLTTGGTLVTLVGTALVPYDFTVVPGPPPPDYEAVKLFFRKGDRLTELPREDFRTELSDATRLVFRMPASPDGRPGQVDIVVSVQLGGVEVAVSSQEFLFANPNPFFGPRGAVLDTQPVAVAPIPLDNAPSVDEAPDFAVLTQEGDVGFLQLLLAQQNGMFQRFGARRQIGAHENAAERNPRDLCTGDFDGDLVPDMFIANEGAATATHHVVLGQRKPNAPLGVVHRIAGEPGTVRARSAKFDGDTLPDLLLVPGPNAPVGLRPQVRLARPTGIGEPAFAAPEFLPVRGIPYEATEIADLDGDGFLDVAVVSGSTLQMDVAFGRGDGTFDIPAVQVDFTVPGYTPTPDSKAIGLHACRDGTLQSLALVLSGSDVVGAVREPLIAVLHQSALRTFAPLVPADVRLVPGTPPLGVSLAADLDESNTLEIAIGVRDVGGLVGSLALLRYIAPRFEFIVGGIDSGAEQPRRFTAMHFERAFPASLTSKKAVFVVHESVIDGVTERRLSTRLLRGNSATQELTLLPPDSGAVVISDVEGIIGGDFHAGSIAGNGSVRDLAVARTGAVVLLENDGFGGFPLPTWNLDAAGLLPSTLQLLPTTGPIPDRLVFVDSSSRVGIWARDDDPTHTQTYLTWPTSPTHLGSELRLLSSSPQLQTATLSDATRARVIDVDGDGVLDIVVLMSFVLPSLGEGQAQIALLRGKPNPASNEFPFFEPTALTPVHGKSTSMVLGDFAAAGPGLPKWLELAVSVPEGTTPGALDGDHVRFFRYVPGATPDQDRFEPSAAPLGAQVLNAGNMPTQLEAADFDVDGRVDLLVAAAGDDTLRLFRNISSPAGAQGQVEIDSFVESPTPMALAPGTPRALRLGDVNGDGSVDAIVAVESVTGGVRSTSLAFYLQSEPGVLEVAVFVSPQRVGNMVFNQQGQLVIRDSPMAIDLGDSNGDGVLDLFLGWETVGASDRNVRVLFGGSR